MGQDVRPAAEYIRDFRSRSMEIDGHRYHYLDDGPRDAPAIVMLHGNPTWCFYYRSLVSSMRARFRVIVPDHMGCGLSARPEPYDYALLRHIENLERLIDALDIDHLSLVMHDWGGAIGMGFAGRHPERIRGLVVMNSAAFFAPRCPLRIRICRVPGIGALLVRGLNGFARAALVFATSQPDRFTPEVRSAYIAPYRSWRERVGLHGFVRDIPLEPGHPTRPVLDSVEASLERLRDHPMLILWGDDDFCFTVHPFLDRWRALFPNARVHVIEGAGHYVLEDAHERVLPSICEFFDRLYPSHRDDNATGSTPLTDPNQLNRPNRPTH